MATLFDIQPDHLKTATDRSAAKSLFASVVSLVEIELFSYCNRRCWFCPNSTIDRISSNTHLDSRLYTSVINQLSEIEYSGTISYSRYNEPLADKIILTRLKEARAALPNAILHTNTNGDYLNPEYLDELVEAGISSLNIQLYLGKDEQYSHDRTKFRASQLFRRTGLDFSLERDDPDEWLEYKAAYKGVAIRMYGRNFAKNGTSRGDEVDIHRDYVRSSPCFMPTWAFYVDFNGSVMPCCNFRSDIESHKPFAVGDLNNNDDIFLTYMNTASASFRRSMLNTEEKTGPCRNCKFALETLDPHAVDLMNSLVEAAG